MNYGLVGVGSVVMCGAALAWAWAKYRTLLARCRALEGEVARARRTSRRLEALLADLVGTVGFGLAHCREGRRSSAHQDFEQVRAAVQQVVLGRGDMVEGKPPLSGG